MKEGEQLTLPVWHDFACGKVQCKICGKVKCMQFFLDVEHMLYSMCHSEQTQSLYISSSDAIIFSMYQSSG